jgi:hypothetical protein
MAAGQGFKTFATGDVLTAADTNGYLMQGVWTFANAAARDAAVTSPQEGNVCYLKDTDAIMTYSGSAWVAVGGGVASFSGCALYKSATQTCTNGAGTVLTWENEYLDTDSFHSTSSNTSRITIPSGKGGKYMVMAQTNFTSDTSSLQTFSIMKNGASVVTNRYGNSRWFSRSIVVSTVVDVVATDYIEVKIDVSGGVNLATEEYATWCYAYLLGA